jgi:hypothetical protein
VSRPTERGEKNQESGGEKPKRREERRKAEGTREEEEEATTTTAAACENERKRGVRRDGTGGRRAGTLRKKWKGGVRQVWSEREEREKVMGGATGGQRRGRMEGRRARRDQERRRGVRPRQNGREGEICSVKKEAKELRRPVSPPCTCRVVNCVCVVGGGWSCAWWPTKRRKKKAFQSPCFKEDPRGILQIFL